MVSPIDSSGIMPVWFGETERRTGHTALAIAVFIEWLQIGMGFEVAAQMHSAESLLLYWNLVTVLKCSVLHAMMGGSILANCSSNLIL